MEKTFAILIDSDNISAKHIPYIIDEINNYGSITYRRMYGDFTSSQMNAWKNVVSEYSLTPIQQFQNTMGKNATDSALIIDAMDILYTGNVQGFCLVSSDSDFTKLASRLREAGKFVIGMGEKKTPAAFRNACNEFKYLNILSGAPQTSVEDEAVAGSRKISKIIEDILEIITTNENKGKETGLGEIGSSLTKRYSDFDVRNYGYNSLSKFIESMEQFELVQNKTSIKVLIRNDISEIKDHVFKILSKQKNQKGILLSKLADELYKYTPNFTAKKFGYSTFLKFVQDIKGIEVKENKEDTQKYVFLSKKSLKKS